MWGGSRNLTVTGLMISSISNGPIKRGASFLDLTYKLMSLALSQTGWPTLYSGDCLRPLSAKRLEVWLALLIAALTLPQTRLARRMKPRGDGESAEASCSGSSGGWYPIAASKAESPVALAIEFRASSIHGSSSTHLVGRSWHKQRRQDSTD